MPCLVLLDLKLPKVSGVEVLRWIRSQPALVSLRVIVFSSSRQWQNVTGALQAHIDAYVAKPMNFNEWVAMVGALKARWLEDR